MTKVAVLVGSLRKESYSKKVADHVVSLLPEGFEPDFVDISNLPLYNQDYDLENDLPETYKVFREQVRRAEAVLFVTPEYNRSVPGVLKNAVDVGSRPKETSVWNDKPAAIISVSPKNLGAFGSNHHLRQSLVFFNMPVLQQPEAYIPYAGSLFDENRKMTDKDTMAFLQRFVDAFIKLIQTNIPN